MEPRLVFLILVCIAVVLIYLIGYWRKKAGNAAFAAALLTDKAEERDRYCRLAVMAGNRDACRMFCFARPDFFEDRHPLKPFRFHGISVAFYGHYYPSRYKRLLSEEQREFCRSLYAFKEGDNHGIPFFQGLHGGPAAGYGLVPHHVHAVQQLDKLRAAFQATSLVHHDPPA